MTVEIERYGVGLDSNIVTYLAEAMTTGYDPRVDDDPKLSAERAAALRVFLYVGDLFIPPTVAVEVGGIRDSARRAYHEMIGEALVSELVNIDETAVARRAENFLALHPKCSDCRVLAEAEVGCLSHLLTLDAQLEARLGGSTPVTIAAPSAFWTDLGLPHGCPPRWVPHPTNPLASQDWWRW